LNSLNRDECSLIKKEEKPYTGSEYHNFIVVLKSLTHFGSKYFAKKRGNLLMRGKLSSLL
jgi:hypothetical protein